MVGRWLRREEITNKSVSTGFVGTERHPQGMVETLGLPAWMVPQEFEFQDMIALALYNSRQGWEEEFCIGLVGAAGWVMGQYPAPVSSDTSGPWPDPDARDAARVEAESWAAGLAGDPDGRLDMTEVCRTLDVPLRIPRQVLPMFAVGVYAGLRWMLGMDAKAPLPLPLRDTNGRPASAASIYADLLDVVERAGGATPGIRKILRDDSERMAQESLVLAKRVGRQRAWDAAQAAAEAAGRG